MESKVILDENEVRSGAIDDISSHQVLMFDDDDVAPPGSIAAKGWSLYFGDACIDWSDVQGRTLRVIPITRYSIEYEKTAGVGLSTNDGQGETRDNLTV